MLVDRAPPKLQLPTTLEHVPGSVEPPAPRPTHSTFTFTLGAETPSDPRGTAPGPAVVSGGAPSFRDPASPLA